MSTLTCPPTSGARYFEPKGCLWPQGLQPNCGDLLRLRSGTIRCFFKNLMAPATSFLEGNWFLVKMPTYTRKPLRMKRNVLIFPVLQSHLSCHFWCFYSHTQWSNGRSPWPRLRRSQKTLQWYEQEAITVFDIPRSICDTHVETAKVPLE